jgi:hypothetical protein
MISFLNHLVDVGKPFILDGDFHAEPQHVAAICAGIVPNFGLLFPEASTCISTSGQSTIDYFVVHGALLGACTAPTVLPHGSAPHLLVQIQVASAVFAQAVDFV